jgi:hypothetical protein
LTLILVAAMTAVAIGAYDYAERWTPLQRLYLGPYVRSTLAATLTRNGRYQLLMVLGRHGTQLALDDEVQAVASPSGTAAFALTDVAIRVGDRQLRWQTAPSTGCVLPRGVACWC